MHDAKHMVMRSIRPGSAVGLSLFSTMQLVAVSLLLKVAQGVAATSPNHCASDTVDLLHCGEQLQP